MGGSKPDSASPNEAKPVPARPEDAKPVFVQPERNEGPKSPLDTAATVLGSIGLGLLVITLGLGALLALPFSLSAWVCASIARRQNPGAVGKRTLGWRLGVSGVALGIGAAIIWSSLEASGFGVLEWLESVQRGLEEQQRQLEPPPGRVTRV